MRYRAQFPRDRSTEPLGDTYWRGVDMRREPHALEPGLASEGINLRFNRGIPETRLGMMFLPWLNKITLGTIVISSITRSGSTATATTASNHGLATDSIATISGATQTEYNGSFIVTVTGATTFTYSVTGSPASPATGSPVLQTYAISPWGTVYGVGVFNDPNTFQDYMVIAADGNIYFTQPNNAAQSMSLPAGITVTSDVTFTQAFDTLIMFRGEELDELQTNSVLSAWNYITQTGSGTGTQPIPRAERALFHQNRLFIPTQDDELAASDFGDYTRYLPVAQVLRINQGSSDKLVNVVKFNDVTIVCFKDRSIYALTEVYGDLTSARLDLLTDQFGLLAANSVAHCGADLLFLSQHGVMSIRQTELNKLQSVVVPLSEPIQPLIDRINWNYASNAVSAYWNNRYYLAVPLDDAEELGHELVQNQATFSSGSDLITISGLTAGQTYRWIKGTDSTSLVNGSITYTNSADFVAAGTSVVINGSDASSNDSVRKLDKGINNAILVYDFLNGAWSGYDQANGVTVKRMFTFPYRGKDRLFIVTHEGWIALYEEDYEDGLAVPYTQVTVASLPSVGNIVQVNTSAVITVINSTTNTATEWGCSDIAAAEQNLFQVNDPDAASWYSYSPFQTTPWAAANTYPNLQGTGTVRFYATNGVLPVVRVSGSWATLTYATTQQITATFVSRGYQASEGDLSDFRWLAIDAQTWNPSFSVDLLTDGAEETFNQASDQTKDRTKWYKPFDKADFDVNNADGRYMDKWREDYSTILGTGTGHATALDVDATDDGVVMDQHQETREQFHVLPTGRSCRVKVTNEQGRIRITGIKLLTQKEYDSALTKA